MQKKTLTYKNKGTRTIKDLSNKKPAHEGVKGKKHEQKDNNVNSCRFLIHICYVVVLSQTRILFFVSDPTEGNYSVQESCHAAVAGRE